jgi:transposase
MSNQRYTPEFKDEAVRQVIDGRHSVQEVGQQLGVSAHSIYKWVNAVKPNNSARHDEELLAAKSQILKLKSELRRTEEERDILKKAAEDSSQQRNTLFNHL